MNAGIRVLVTGGRDYANRHRVWDVLDEVREESGIFLVIEGGCRHKTPKGLPVSADRYAAEWAHANEVPCLTAWAPWRRHGRAAGPIRNAWMVEKIRPHLGLVFPGRDGTADCRRCLVAAGVTVRDISDV